jgi:hypothetical protein
MSGKSAPLSNCDAKVVLFLKLTKGFGFFFLGKNIFLFLGRKSHGKYVPLWAENGGKWIN